MNLKSVLNVLLVVVTVIFWGCQDDVAGAGASALGEEDAIRVKADTFVVNSALGESEAISLSADSFLLGECDTHFGTIHADMLTQFACPVGYKYPETMVIAGDTIDTDLQVDSVFLYLYYQTWYGDSMAPLGITVYEMDRATLDYDTRYPNDTVLSSFCSLADSTCVSAAPRIVIAGEPTDSVLISDESYMPCIRIPLSEQFAKRFFAIRDFSSQEAFNQLFKGLYISTDFGGSTVLYVKEIGMAVHYHFSYPHSNKGDTIVNDVKLFYANSEVRQVNRYIYPDRNDILAELKQNADTNFIVSPANIHTRLSIDLDSIFHRIEAQLGDAGDYRVYVNRANLTVDVLYDDDLSYISTRPRDQWDLPASYMLLVLEDKMESFFTSNELPSDTTAILASLTSVVDTIGNVSYNYSYDLSGLLTYQLRADNRPEELHFILVPVAVETSSSSSVSAVKPLQTITATCIRSANSSSQPMDVEVVYSGFNSRVQ